MRPRIEYIAVSRHWWDRTYGSSYFSAQVFDIRMTLKAVIPFQYGDNSHAEDTIVSSMIGLLFGEQPAGDYKLQETRLRVSPLETTHGYTLRVLGKKHITAYVCMVMKSCRYIVIELCRWMVVGKQLLPKHD